MIKLPRCCALPWLVLILCLATFAPAWAASVPPASPQARADKAILQPQPFLPMVRHETGGTFSHNTATRVELLADRCVYWPDDRYGQFVALFFTKVKPDQGQDHRIDLTLRDQNGRVVEETRVQPVTSPKLPILVATQRLEPGRYTLSATLIGPGDTPIATLERAFERSDRRVEPTVWPHDGVPIVVHDQELLPDAVWPISTGVPIPRATLDDLADLLLLEDGQPAPAQFTARGTWSPHGPIKWVGVDFLARYRDGKPSQYRLVRRPGGQPPAGPAVTVRQDEREIVVDTGAIRFVVNKQRFAGLEQVWLGDRLVVDGPAGSRVTDQDGTVYEAARDPDVQVTLEDAGPVRATIAAKGWYVSASGQKFCQFVIRLSAFAGRPDIALNHRTILTATPVHGDARYLADAQFALASAQPLTDWRFGGDGAGHALDGTEASLHQERSDRYRLLRGGEPSGQGRRSDGWFAARTGDVQLVGSLRDVWQRFPAELALSPSAMTFHFWPRHGRDVFTDDEELARNQVYKVRFAHEGRVLNMLIPDKYHERIKALDQSESWAGGAELVVVRKDGRTKVQMYDGMGAALGGEAMIRFHARPQSDQALLAEARLMQQSPHALSDPAWNAASGALGPIAPRDPQRFGPAENLMDSAYNFYQRAIIDGGDCYGRWIYGGVHSSWDAMDHQANLTRVWQMCHYQNVTQAWLLYYRSGLPDHWRWATIHTNQHVDVGVSNYHAYPKGSHSYDFLGDLGGGIYHCKGFVPWGGNGSTSGHWIDIAHYFLRYQMTGDRRGLDMAQRWMDTLNVMSHSNKIDWPADASGLRDPAVVARIDEWNKQNPKAKPADQPDWIKQELAKPAPYNPREELVPLGELAYYYASTWDPQALIYLDQYAAVLNTPFRLTSAPSLAHFGKHWQDWYHELTRDPRVVQRVQEYMQEQSLLRQPPRYDSFAAFLYHATGDDRWVRALVADVYRATLNVYDNPEDRYHQYSLAHSNPAAMLLGRLPLFLHAVDAAGLTFAPTADDPATAPTRGGRVDPADKWLLPGRGWSNTGLTVLAWTPQPVRVAVRIDGPTGYGSFRGFYRLLYDWPTLDAMPLTADLRPWYEKQKQDIIRFPAANAFKDPPENRNFSGGHGEQPLALPYLEQPEHDPQRRFYRLEVGGDAIDLPALQEAQGGKPLAQVAVIARTLYTNGQIKPATFRVIGACDLLLRPLDEKAVVQLQVQAVAGRYAMPSTLHLTDAQGRTIARTSVFAAGQRTQDRVTLDPAQHPLPWRFQAAASGDNAFSFEGADELFFAQSAEDFNAILPKLQVTPPRTSP